MSDLVCDVIYRLIQFREIKPETICNEILNEWLPYFNISTANKYFMTRNEFVRIE